MNNQVKRQPNQSDYIVLYSASIYSYILVYTSTCLTHFSEFTDFSIHNTDLLQRIQLTQYQNNPKNQENPDFPEK